MESAFAAYRSAGILEQKIHSKKLKNITKIKKRNRPFKSQMKNHQTIKKNDIMHGIRNITKNIKIEKNPGNKLKQKKYESSPPMAATKAQVHTASTSLNRDHKKSKSSHFPTDSIETGRKMFAWMMDPTNADNFFRTSWEKSHIHIKRNNKNYFSKLLSIQMIDKMIRQNRVEFTKNLDITSYENGERNTHNPEGRALSSVVWDFYNNGCSLRLLNPQTFIPQVHSLTGTLQELFQCMTGANVYLTPANSQGFAPHYDDIEAFILQIEGKKHWKLYHPLSDNEILPRYSSRNFNQSEIGKPFFEAILEAGDVLYFPRGIIHQANTVKGTHSLHLTLSVYQKNSWADLMESLVPAALNNAIENDLEFREGLPINLGQCMGTIFSDTSNPERNKIIKKVKTLFDKLFQYAPVDDSVDQMHKKFQWDAMPPYLQPDELKQTVYGIVPKIGENGLVEIPDYITPEVRVRLVRKNILRIVNEGEKTNLYFSSENSKEYHEFEQIFLEIDPAHRPIFEHLIEKYPEYSAMQELPIQNMEECINVIRDLFEKGLIMIDEFLS